MIDLAAVKRAHAQFLDSHKAMTSRVGNAASKRALSFVWANPGFTPRSVAAQRGTKSHVKIMVGGVLVRVENRVNHAIFLEKGTKAHDIRPRNKKYLRFWAGGGWVFSKGVKHPGTKPTRFLSRARDNAYEWAGAALRREMNRVAHNF